MYRYVFFQRRLWFWILNEGCSTCLWVCDCKLTTSDTHLLQVEDFGSGSQTDAVLAISSEVLVIQEESSKSVIFTVHCGAIIGWTAQANRSAIPIQIKNQLKHQIISNTNTDKELVIKHQIIKHFVMIIHLLISTSFVIQYQDILQSRGEYFDTAPQW